jgi:catechol 2,3-dioxygenase-like lactoylglutathione lyase family enzyme
MTDAVRGIHHVTAISGEIDRTLDFYGRILGLRQVKQTVNYDDPATYHLYFGDELGRPGTIVTFFPWPGFPCGRIKLPPWLEPDRLGIEHVLPPLPHTILGPEAPNAVR